MRIALLAALVISTAPLQAVEITIDRTLSDRGTLVFDLFWGGKASWHELGRPFEGDMYDPYYLITYTDWGGSIELSVMLANGSLDYTGPDGITFRFDDENNRTFVGSSLVASERVTPLDGNFAARGARFSWGNPIAAVPDSGSTWLLASLAFLGLFAVRRYASDARAGQKRAKATAI